MKRITATILLLTYLAFVPLCFSGAFGHSVSSMSEGQMQGMHENSCGRSAADCLNALEQSLAEHSGMYRMVTSTGVSPLLFIGVLFFFVMYILVETTISTRARYCSDIRRFDKQRQEFSVLSRGGIFSYLLRLIASPNLAIAFA